MLSWNRSSLSTDKSAASRPLFSPTPDELRALVLDYLCHSSFTNTARAFVRDSAVKHLDADGDELMSTPEKENPDLLAETLEDRLSPSQIRRDIQIHILSGRVDAAIALLNTHFPTVLSEESENTEATPEATTSDKFSYVPTTSVDPTHLALNLRILAFIETARTIPLPYYPPGSSTSPASPPTSPTPPDPARTDEDMEFSAQQHDLLHRAQSLYSEAHCLTKPADRALYLTELSQVSGLLAYTDPENSPMAPYLSQERREAVADQVESAILFRTKQSSLSTLELLTRYTTTVWSTLHEWEVKTPSPSRWPTGVQLPPTSDLPLRSKTSESTGNTLSAKKANADKDSGEPLPAFNLTAFLDAKP